MFINLNLIVLIHGRADARKSALNFGELVLESRARRHFFFISFKMGKFDESKFTTYVRYFLSNCYFKSNVSPSETMKNVFYFI